MPITYNSEPLKISHFGVWLLPLKIPYSDYDENMETIPAWDATICKNNLEVTILAMHVTVTSTFNIRYDENSQKVEMTWYSSINN